MKYTAPLILLLALIVGVYVGVELLNLTFVFGIIIPVLAFSVFLIGFTYKIVQWALLPVPYRIPTTCGQAPSLDFIPRNRLESPAGFWETVLRMALEVLLFRSLFRNTRAEVRPGPELAYRSNKWLWAGGLVMHWAMLVIVLRHYRFFLEPVPGLITALESMDGFLELSLPTLYLTDILFLLAVAFLLIRRFLSVQIRHISLPQDYFPLYLLLVIGITGVLMRNGIKTDVAKVKALMRSIVELRFEAQQGIATSFYIHLFCVSLLAAYFPFSKLMHMGGVFFSPTRNMANNNRAVRHVNPHNPQVKIKSYAEYEQEFAEKMTKAGIPLDGD
ncbi:MAG: sulfate reduction electron transfer complex DsrMKJOP subunit DsrM [Deltaproteobacteria bacterium]|nr:sulfate reduction electron transfer complex DsrMKJOP subunit DsrM [Deltaproteobacteria bacterium]